MSAFAAELAFGALGGAALLLAYKLLGAVLRRSGPEDDA